MTESMTDAAMLWADKNAQYGTARHYGVMGFRAGQAHERCAGAGGVFEDGAMTTDVERVARALAYLDNGADGAWKHYVDVAIVAMRVTREIDAAAMRSAQIGFENAADWLQQRAKEK